MIKRRRTEAFVIGKKDKGEADQIIVLYTKNFGKAEIFAKGIRKIDSKLKSGVNLLSLSYVEFIESPRRKTLVDAKVISSFSGLKETKRFMIALKIKEKLEMAVREEEKDEKIWRLLKETFEALEKEDNFSLFYCYFFWNVAAILGYKPNLNRCSFCGKRIDAGRAFFSPEKGFVDCSCSEGLSPVPEETMKLVKFFLDNKIERIAKIKTENLNLSFVEKMSDMWFFSKICVK